MKPQFTISLAALSINDVKYIIDNNVQLILGEDIKDKVTKNREYLEKRLNSGNELIYGINTGFGSLCDIEISKSDIALLQTKLIISHAAGIGNVVSPEISRLILFLKIVGLSKGYSGVRLELIEKLVYFFNEGIYPYMYELGSLGASGDLAPLAHLSLPLINMGKVWYNGIAVETNGLFSKLGIKPLELASKEGLALLNGTQFSTGYAVWNLIKSKNLFLLSNKCVAVGMEAFDCNISPFNALIHDIRPHEGQKVVAKYIFELFEGDELITRKKENVQDPYAYRCVPQVHGATYDTLAYVEKILAIEINSVTDNPTIFDEANEIISGGNFHAQPIALASDFLCIAMSELANISERRIYQLISGKRSLPAFLTPNPGLNSGLMIAQYTAASIVSQNKQLSSPASVDSIVSCNGQEDHVSMAANAGTKCKTVVDNVERVLAIEWLTAMQALSFRNNFKINPKIREWETDYRKQISVMVEDRFISDDIVKTVEFIRSHEV
jgi:histidine ammonia-lyase